MNRSFIKLISLFVAAAAVFCLAPVFSGASSSSSHASVSVTPGELSAPGPVTVSITLRNTNTAPSITDQPSVETPVPVDPSPTDPPESTPGPDSRSEAAGTYTDISISNSYGVSFSTSGVSIAPGSYRTFSATVNATNEMIGVPLSFTVTWSCDGSKFSETVSCTITRKNAAPYLHVTRTAYPAHAAPGTEVTLKYTFTNTGSVRLVNIELTDRNISGKSSPMYTIAALEPGATDEFVYVMKMGNSTVTSSPTVTFYAYGESTQRTNKDVPALTIGLINSQLTKKVDMGESTPEGVQFIITLENNGNQNLSSLKVTDELGNQVCSSFSLAVGEIKQIEYFVSDPDEVRYVVFYIRGTDKSGTEFKDNTQSYIVRPYIDKSKEKLSFTAVTTSSVNEEMVIGIEFNVENTGLLDLFNLSVTEERLGYELYRWHDLGIGQSEKAGLDINIGEVRALVFVLTAEDSSGNTYTYEAHVSAEQIDVGHMVPINDPSKQSDPLDIDPETYSGIGKKLDGLITDTGAKLQQWFRVLGIVAAAAAVCMLGLGISEIVIRRNKRSGGKKSQQ